MRSVTVARPGILLLLLLLPVAYASWRKWPPPLSRAHRRAALILRTVIVVLLVLAIAGVHVTREPAGRAMVAVVDLSDSTRPSEEEATKTVAALAKAKGRDDLFGIVTFGRDAQVELPPTRTPVFDGFQTHPEPGYSNLSSAIQLAANLIPDGYGRQIVVLSDGRQNIGDAGIAAAGLRRQSVRIDVVPIGAAPQADVAILALEAPAIVREDQALAITARLRAAAAAGGTITLELDGREVARREVNVPLGASAQAFEMPPMAPGVHRFRAVIDAQPDGVSQNNLAEAVVRVVGHPVVLVIEGAPKAAVNVDAALKTAGMETRIRRPAETPTDPAELAKYDAVVVVDAPADAFPTGAASALAASVHDLGRGFVAIGGTASFGPGGWQGTPFEEALPVRMEAPRPKQRPQTAVVMAIETMEFAEGDRVTLGATQSVLEQLGPTDQFGFVVLDQGGDFVGVPLTSVTDRAGLLNRVQRHTLGDPPGYASGLRLAINTVASSTAATKHVVLIGDGDATNGIPEYEGLFASARSQGITVSVVGVATHNSVGDMDHMRTVAQFGGGRFFLSHNASEVPQILLNLSRATFRPWFEQEPFFPKVTSAGDLLSGVSLDRFPQLGGYVVTTPKSNADVALSTPKDDPLLAGWQYGLGRSVAWTSDAVGRWTGGFLGSPVSAALFARMVAWTLPAPPDGGLRVEAVTAASGLDFTVTATEPGGDVELEIVGPDSSRLTEALRSTSPGRWVGSARVEKLGTYVVHAVHRRDGQVTGQSEITVALPYSPEYLELGRDDGVLAQLAARGGAVLSRPLSAWSLKLPALAVTSNVFWILLLLALLAWPFDVAVRRLNLSTRQALAALWSLVRFRRPKDIEVAVPESLSRLRQRMESHRRGETEVAPAPPGGEESPASAPGGEGEVVGSEPHKE